MKHTKLRHLILSSLALTIFTGCGDDDNDDPTPPPPVAAPEQPGAEDSSSFNLVNTLTTDSRFSTLSKAVEEAGLNDVLLSADFTIFAPTDAAFAALPEGTLDSLLADKEKLKEVLLYHVVNGKLSSENVISTAELESANDLDLEVKTSEGQVFVNGAQVIATDLQASNGIVHAIDQVLLPSTIYTIAELTAQKDNLSTLLTAIKTAGLGEVLSGEEPFTVFAPTNDAFAAIGQDELDRLLEQPDQLRDILLYHVVEGRYDAEAVAGTPDFTSALGQKLTIEKREDGSYVNDSRLVTTDIKAANGIIHVIDAVMLPAGDSADEPAEEANIVELAEDAGKFTVLLQALKLAGLSATLEQDGPFTVFAPTDEAFAKLDPTLLENLLAEPSELAKVLSYHVVADKLLAKDVLEQTELATILEGRNLNISTIAEGGVMINDANITQTDLVGSNGVIHVIDTVLIPSAVDASNDDDTAGNTITDIASSEPEFSTLVGLLERAELTEVLASEGPFTVFAPTNAAFEKLQAEVVDYLIENPEALKAVLSYHVVSGSYDKQALSNATEFTTVQGDALTISGEGDELRAADAAITAFDVKADNGLIHVIDSVMLPPNMR
ncbi:MAG: fasciclin domain-containing protein [Oligoflexus sp.]